jgi:hypothetical protein
MVNVFKHFFDFTIEGIFFGDYWCKIDLNDIEKKFIFKIIILIPIINKETLTINPKLTTEVVFERQLQSGELVMLNSKLYRMVSINIEATDFFDAMNISQQILNEINLQLLTAIQRKVEIPEEKPEEKVA